MNINVCLCMRVISVLNVNTSDTEQSLTPDLNGTCSQEEEGEMKT